jgi:hypothetical protein
MRDCMPALTGHPLSIMQTLCITLCSAQGMPGGCPGDARETPGPGDFKKPIKNKTEYPYNKNNKVKSKPLQLAGKNHGLAQSLLSRFFSWDVVDVGLPIY